MDRISGSYPGGPRRRSDLGERPVDPALPTVREIAEEEARAELEERHRRRARRRVLAVTAALVVSGTSGTVVGVLAHRSTEEITAEREERRLADTRPRDVAPDSQSPDSGTEGDVR